MDRVGVEPTGPEGNGFTDRSRPLRDYLSMIGGDERDRTASLLLARQVLSQLSYIPNFVSKLSKNVGRPGRSRTRTYLVRSQVLSPLSYRPINSKVAKYHTNHTTVPTIRIGMVTPPEVGRSGRDRTYCLLLVRQALFQMSYAPSGFSESHNCRTSSSMTRRPVSCASSSADSKALFISDDELRGMHDVPERLVSIPVEPLFHDVHRVLLMMIGEPSRTRTYDLVVRNHVLYPLSYRLG